MLNVLSVLLKKAVAWGVIERMPCSIELLKTAKSLAAFYDFDEFEKPVAVAREIDHRTYLAVLLGAEAGLRCGEMIALEWADVDLGRRKLCVRRSDWNGQIGTPKGGRHRFVPLTLRLEAALRQHRHLRSSRVLCQDDGGPRRRFDDDFKAQAVRLVLDEGKSVGSVARDLDLTETALREWVNRARADRTKGKTGLTTAEREELARLRRENRILQEEREILKKAAAFFAKHQR